MFPKSHLNPLEPDPRLLANLMLPDGAEKHLEDWTSFFLNQTPFSMIAPVLALETPDHEEKEHKSKLLFILDLVWTKHEKTVQRLVASQIHRAFMPMQALKRGAVVKAMAICTPHPFTKYSRCAPCTCPTQLIGG